jgi:hypothetical protein
MKTEIRDGQRVWTKDSIEIILEGYKPHQSDDYWYKLGAVFRGGLIEAGFSEPKTLLENKITLHLNTQKWFCPIHLLRLDDGQIVFLFDLEMHPARDLIYLWDYIREAWSKKIKGSDYPISP